MRKNYDDCFGVTVAIALVSFVGLEILRTFVRPIYGKGEGFLSIFLGSTPNFLAALGMPLLGASAYFYSLYVIRVEGDGKHLIHANFFKRSYIMLGFVLITSLSSLGLIAWEIQQKHNHLFFDTNDIIATLLGGVVSICFFSLCMKYNRT